MTSKSLFSDHFLTKRLPELEAWQIDSEDVRSQLQQLYDDQKDTLPELREAQLETNFLQPILGILGYHYQVQTTLKQRGKVNYPDYTTFADETTRKDADRFLKEGGTKFYSRALNIIEAKYWDRPLSKKLADVRNERFSNADPSFQIVNYLTGTKVEWGILTNGRKWRLYNRNVSNTATEFYEVDLLDALADEDAFKRFWLFFRKEAFVADAHGKNFVQRVLDGSTQYAREVGDQLKKLVFREVFPLLAGGFVADCEQRGEEIDTKLIYEATLSLLYKLLFLLYAEARELLPVRNEDYREYSLTKLTQKVEEGVERGRKWSNTAPSSYRTLLELFRIIDTGDASLILPRYNGGLFHFADTSDEKYRANRFLETHTIADSFLAPALDKLTRLEGERIDYRYIGVRNLGAVYEGLLEFNVNVKDAAAGTVELVTDKGERKATGSYYTPDYIVKYIVEQTLAPLLAEREERFTELMGEIAPKREQWGEIADSDTAERNELEQELARLEVEARQVLLDVKVCDPAMGSGHFLVEAVDYLTTELIAILARHEDANPILESLEQIRGEIQQTSAENGIIISDDQLTDTQLLQRVVMKRCIYGVDLNPMAVELAKVSLWLHSFTVGAPLSFLDHHLRCGNSLVGMMAREAAEEFDQKQKGSGQLMMGMFEGPFRGLLHAAELMRGVSQLSDATFAEVEESERLFAAFDEAAMPYKRLLDVSVARHFGVKRAQEVLDLYGTDVIGTDTSKMSASYQKALAQTWELYKTHRFFHWDLEFPEVFIDLSQTDWKNNPGFDAMIGNPPYVRQEQITPLKAYLKSQYDSYSGGSDLYVYFYEHGVQLLKNDGLISFITSGTFARSNYAQPFRQWIASNSTIKTIIDFGENQPFEDAEMARPSIMVLKRGRITSEYLVLVVEETTIPDDLSEAVDNYSFSCVLPNDLNSEWVFQPKEHSELFQKIMRLGTPLELIVDGNIFYGVKTGLNEAFIISEEQKQDLVESNPINLEILRPMIRGADLRPWYHQESTEWLIFARHGINITHYPEVVEHLSHYKTRLIPKPRDWNSTSKWQGRKPGSYKWFEIQDNVAYFKEFDTPKIFWCEITKQPRFVWDDAGTIINNAGYIISNAKPEWLGFLQSRVNWFAVSQICQPFRLRAGLWQYKLYIQYAKRLPMPTMSEDDRLIIGNLAMEITRESKERYKHHERVRRRILTNFDGEKLNQKLTAWWSLDFKTFMREVKKVFKQKIPLDEQDEWQEYLEKQQAKHHKLTATIVRLETELNTQVYRLFDLTDEEIAIIEESTKYKYGTV